MLVKRKTHDATSFANAASSHPSSFLSLAFQSQHFICFLAHIPNPINIYIYIFFLSRIPLITAPALFIYWVGNRQRSNKGSKMSWSNFNIYIYLTGSSSSSSSSSQLDYYYYYGKGPNLFFFLQPQFLSSETYNSFPTQATLMIQHLSSQLT